jgi:chorismate mutase
MTTDSSVFRSISIDELPNDISQCASRIDVIDRQIGELLLNRFQYSRHIGTLKAQLGAEPFDPVRVRDQKASFIGSCVRGGLDEKMAGSVIDAILDEVVSERLAPGGSVSRR